MSKNVILQGYNTIIPNSTYGRKVLIPGSSILESSPPSTEIIQISRMTIPSVEEVVDVIRKAVEELDFAPNARTKYPLGRDSLG